MALPEGGILRLALGLTPGHPVAVTFRVVAGDATILERRIDASGAWEEHEIALPPSSEPCRLRFEVKAVLGRLDPVKGFPLWGDLLILAPGEG